MGREADDEEARAVASKKRGERAIEAIQQPGTACTTRVAEDRGELAGGSGRAASLLLLRAVDHGRCRVLSADCSRPA